MSDPTEECLCTCNDVDVVKMGHFNSCPKSEAYGIHKEVIDANVERMLRDRKRYMLQRDKLDSSITAIDEILKKLR